MIRFSCPGCGAVFSVSDDKAGKTGNCPKCQTKFTIPAAEAPAPAPPASNPFTDLGDDSPRKKKAPSKADLDDDVPRKKKAPSKADLDDEDDRPRKKPVRAVDDDEDDRPRKKPARRDEDDEDDVPKKKKPVRAVDDDEDDRPRKKPARRDDDEDDYDDRPKKKPVRAAVDDEDDYDDRPRKKGRRDDDYEDDYDDRPRRRKGKSGLLLTAAILHIIAAVLYIPCGGVALFAGGVANAVGQAGGTGAKLGGGSIKVDKGGMTDQEFKDAVKAFDTLEKGAGELKAVGTVIQILGALCILGGILAIPAAVAGFTKKRWFVGVTLATGGLFLLIALIRLVTSFMYVLMALEVGSILSLVVLPLAYGVLVVMAATNKNVKRVLS